MVLSCPGGMFLEVKKEGCRKWWVKDKYCLKAISASDGKKPMDGLVKWKVEQKSEQFRLSLPWCFPVREVRILSW